MIFQLVNDKLFSDLGMYDGKNNFQFSGVFMIFATLTMG